jgi:hypothetical protein
MRFAIELVMMCLIIVMAKEYDKKQLALIECSDKVEEIAYKLFQYQCENGEVLCTRK